MNRRGGVLQGVVAETASWFRSRQPGRAGLEALKERESVITPSLRLMLTHLLSRGVSPDETSRECDHEEAESVDSDTGPLQLPDSEWLRQSQLHSVSLNLEESPMKRTRRTLEELAFRLGEQTPERQQTAILVRRVAMRMRSVQIEKVVDSLSVAAKNPGVAGRKRATDRVVRTARLVGEESS